MIPSEHVNDRKKDILILGKTPTQGLDVTALTTEKEYAINFNEHQNRYMSHDILKVR